MVREFFDLSPEEQKIVLVPVATLRKAEWFIESCEHCNPEGAEIPFDYILERVRDTIRWQRIIFWRRRQGVRTADVKSTRRR